MNDFVIFEEADGSYTINLNGGEITIKGKQMNKPHKHAELIKAWADGAEIECSNGLGYWVDDKNPDWHDWNVYRIKPEPKPDVVGNVYANSLGTLEWIMGQMKPNLKLTFDGETGELKSAEVLK